MGIIERIGSLFKNDATMKEPEWWRQTMGGSMTNAGVNVTVENAMTLTAVYSSVRIIAESIASLPLVLYERNGDQKRPATDHPLFPILHDIPNDTQTSFEMIEFGMANTLLRGNMYNHVQRNGRGDVMAITPLKAAYMEVKNGASGLIFNYTEPNNERVYQQREIWRMAGLGSDGVVGLSPIQLAKQSLGLGLAAEQYGAMVYSNGAQVPAVLETDGQLTPEQYTNLKQQWTDSYGGLDNAFKTAILEGGLKYHAVGLSLEDAQFVTTRKMQIAEVSRMYRVPMHMLSELDRATFSNIEQQSIEFVMHTIRPWLVRLEKSISRDLLPPSERGKYYAKFKVEGLLRGDTKSRYEAYGMGIRDGWLNRNEARKLEDLNPADGLDEFILPLNMTEQGEEPEQTPESAANSLRAAEIKALTIEAGRLTDDEFKAWSVGFYSRFQQKLIENGVSEQESGEICAARVNLIHDQDSISNFIDGLKP